MLMRPFYIAHYVSPSWHLWDSVRYMHLQIERFGSRQFAGHSWHQYRRQLGNSWRLQEGRGGGQQCQEGRKGNLRCCCWTTNESASVLVPGWGWQGLRERTEKTELQHCTAPLLQLLSRAESVAGAAVTTEERARTGKKRGDARMNILIDV